MRGWWEPRRKNGVGVQQRGHASCRSPTNRVLTRPFGRRVVSRGRPAKPRPTCASAAHPPARAAGGTGGHRPKGHASHGPARPHRAIGGRGPRSRAVQGLRVPSQGQSAADAGRCRPGPGPNRHRERRSRLGVAIGFRPAYRRAGHLQSPRARTALRDTGTAQGAMAYAAPSTSSCRATAHRSVCWRSIAARRESSTRTTSLFCRAQRTSSAWQSNVSATNAACAVRWSKRKCS
jgi:hypothetical protein